MFLQARVRHLLSLPAGTPLAPLGVATRLSDKQRDSVWDGFTFQIPSFHSTVFWECELLLKKRANNRERGYTVQRTAAPQAARLQHDGGLLSLAGLTLRSTSHTRM